MINTRIKAEKMNLSLFNLTSKVATVTGSGRGVGRAIALGFAQAGVEASAYVTGEITVVSGGLTTTVFDWK